MSPLESSKVGFLNDLFNVCVEGHSFRLLIVHIHVENREKISKHSLNQKREKNSKSKGSPYYCSIIRRVALPT